MAQTEKPRDGDVKYSIEKWEAKTDIFTSKLGGGK
jgi:hypothetical protein